jgi:hypothetical protein
MSGSEVAIVVHYQATAGKGDGVAALPDGSLWMRSARSPS